MMLINASEVWYKDQFLKMEDGQVLEVSYHSKHYIGQMGVIKKRKPQELRICDRNLK